MEAALIDALGAEVELVKGRGGVFDVVADGQQVFSKHEVNRFPENDEVVDAIRALG